MFAAIITQLVKAPDITLNIRVVPRASKSEIVGLQDDVVKVRIAAPPVDGAANAELIKLLAKAFGVPKSGVEIVSGLSGRTKRVRIVGTSEAAIQQVLMA